MRELFLIIFLLLNVYASDKLEELIKYNDKLSTLYREVGAGMMGGKYNVEFDKLIHYPHGSCSQQGYLLARKAKELGFKTEQLGLFSKTTGTNDVMVNVTDGDSQFLFVPSAGAYYKNSLWQILDNIKLADNFIVHKTKSDHVLNARSLYLSASFFKTLENIKIYHLNNYESNLLKYAKEVSSKNLFTDPYNEKHLLDFQNKYYTAGEENKPYQSIQYVLKESFDIYRFYFQWYSPEDYAQKIKVILNDNETLEFDNKIDGIETEIVLPAMKTKIQKIEFKFSDFHGQNRLLLKGLGVY
ncbi:hypothetical protein [Sulfurospirillum oryzae]|uniref:hypothetical protein n=1 Tax=Sulfurospirillum oryzae TaxID=2976535 RepID=UPI0021E7C79C|nr:hypothetical protein [Sulfurospirillum oryzae]